MQTPSDFVVMHADPIVRVELALADIAAGRMVILTDDEDRENEGDLVIAAERITPEAINFMATHARGLICLSLTGSQVERLGLPMMTAHNQSAWHTAFTVSIEAREGVSTGISASDRARTVAVAIRPEAHPRDIVTPGHIFPLRARDGGVLERVGQTEGSVDLARMAGLLPAGVICEVMNADGSMSRLPELLVFGAIHRVRLVAVADLIRYRMRNERVVNRSRDGAVEIPGLGQFHTRLYTGLGGTGRHVALWRGQLDRSPTLVRVATAPPVWSFLGDGVDAGADATRKALVKIAAEGRGAVVLMHLSSPTAVVDSAFVADFQGERTQTSVPAADVLRDLGTGCQILLDLGLGDLRLVTQSSRPIVGIEAYGLRVVERVSPEGICPT